MSYLKKIKSFGSGSLSALIAFGLLAVNTSTTTATGATQVTAELMLSIDVSGSVDSEEYALQMEGYAAAFEDDDVIELIENMPNGLAVSVQFWSSEPVPAQPWRVLEDEDDAEDFAEYLEGLSRPSSSTTSVYGYPIGSSTNITGAIHAAKDSILNNQYTGGAMVIDVSGDGLSNGTQWHGPESSDRDGYCGNTGDSMCQGVINARNLAVNSGITINGLPIENSNGETTITSYYDAHVKGGTSGFIETASSFSDFTRAAKAKIFQEVSAAVTPNAQPDFITANEDTTATYNVIAGDPNNNNAGQDTDPNNNTITVTKLVVGTTEYDLGTTITMPSGALLTLASNGDLTYNPNGQFESYSANDSLPTKDKFTYTISDTSGYQSSAIATLDINGVADNPEAADDIVSTDENTSTDIDVLANDTDVDSEANELSVTQINGIAIRSGSVINLTSGSSITLNADGTLKYDPANNIVLQLQNDGDSQIETIEYTVSDELGNTDTADIKVTVTGISDTFAD